jgi:hypothetical protein
VVLVVSGVQEEWLKTMECFVVNYSVQAETKAFGSEEEEVGGGGEALEALERNIAS